MKKMKRYQEGGSTEVSVEKKSILDDIGLKGLPLGIMGQGLVRALEDGDLGGQGLLGMLIDRKKKRQAGMPGTPEDGSTVKIEIEKSKGMESNGMKPMESAVGGRMGYKKGGRIDGIAIRGKTKGTYR